MQRRPSGAPVRAASSTASRAVCAEKELHLDLAFATASSAGRRAEAGAGAGGLPRAHTLALASGRCGGGRLAWPGLQDEEGDRLSQFSVERLSGAGVTGHTRHWLPGPAACLCAYNFRTARATPPRLHAASPITCFWPGPCACADPGSRRRQSLGGVDPRGWTDMHGAMQGKTNASQ